MLTKSVHYVKLRAFGCGAVGVLIAADMEGIAGIEDYGDCLPSHPAAYARGRRLMTDEALVAHKRWLAS